MMMRVRLYVLASLLLMSAGGFCAQEDVRIGIYAYRASFLHAFGELAPAPLEQVESLEQLRALYHGYKIGVSVIQDAPPSGVDTEQDLQSVRQLFKNHS